eukprot:COSAG02_NODE_21_length_53083_cov_95.733618_21_plen_68_part_00
MEGTELFPGKSDAEVEAELAQATRQLEMLKASTGPAAPAAAAPAAAGAAPPASEEDCARSTLPSHRE